METLETITNLLFQASIENASKAQNEFKRSFQQLPTKEAAKNNGNFRINSQILVELHNTEVSYLLQLEILIKFFYQPLSAKNLLITATFDTIFGNILQLYNINRELLLAITKDPWHIYNALSTFGPYLKLYSIYAYGYKKGLEKLEEEQRKNKKLHQFIKNQETRPEVSATIISLLIAPIQRVPRYRLLLQSLLSHTSLDDSQYAEIQDALSKVEETADHINRLITEAEDGEKLVVLARRLGSSGSQYVIPGRKILKQGLVYKSLKSKATSQRRYLVLFTDALLICRGGEKGPLTVNCLLPLQHVAVESVLGSSLFRVTCSDDSFLLHTTVPAEGAHWINEIQDAKNKYQLCRRTLRKDCSKRALREDCSSKTPTAKLLDHARRICGLTSSSPILTKIKKLRKRLPE